MRIITLPHLGKVYMLDGGIITLKEIIQHLGEKCEWFMAQQGFVTPMYHIVTRDGFHLILAPPDKNKNIAVEKIRILLKLVDAVLYGFCDEAWMASYTPEEVQDPTIARPEDRPNREEIVLIQAECEREGELTARRKIIRTKGKPPVLGPLEIDRYDQSSGRMVGILPQRGTVQ
jgi:hypothetical protein